MKACVVKFFKRLWSVFIHLFCFIHAKREEANEEESE